MAAVAYRSALGRVGFNANTVALLESQGFDSVASFRGYTSDDMTHLFKHLSTWKSDDADGDVNTRAMITFAGRKKFMAFFTYVRVQYRAGQTASSAEFTGDVIDDYTVHYNTLQQDKVRLKDLDKPPSFVSWTKWKEFDEALQAYLGQVRSDSPAGPLLIYLLRDQDRPTAADLAANYPTVDGYLLACATFTHSNALYDNKLLYSLLVELTMKTPAYTHIKEFKSSADGRSAYLALKQQGEGPAAKALRKVEARNAIKAAVYTGKGSFTHQAYSEIHVRGHAELEHLEEPVPGSQKVSDYLAGIRCPELETQKIIAEADPTMQEDFKACQQYMQSAVNKARMKKQHARSIASVRGNEGGKRKGGSGRNGGGGNHKSTKSNKRQKRYSNQEWKELDPAVKKDIIAARKAKKEQRQASATKKVADSKEAPEGTGMLKALQTLVQENGVPDSNGQKSLTLKVAAMSVSDKEDNAKPKAVDSIKKNAGVQFGMRAHRKGTSPAIELDDADE